MTLHINEIGVRMAVGDPASAPAPQPSTASPVPGGQGLSSAPADALVQACVRQVLRSQRTLQER